MSKNDIEERVLSKKEVEQFRKDALNQLNGELKEELVNNVVTDVKRELDKVVKDVEESIDIEYKRELSESIKNELVEDIKSQIKKEENKLSRRKSWKIFRLNIYLIVIIAFCGFLIYELYRNDDLALLKLDIFTTTKTKEEMPQTTTTTVVHDLNWYIDKYGYLMENIHITDKELIKGNILLKDVDPSIKLSMAYKTLEPQDIVKDGLIYRVDATKLGDTYKKIFGELDTIVPNFTSNNASFVYLSETSAYLAIASELKTEDELFNNVIDIKEENEYINITALVGIKKDDNIYNVDNLETPIQDNDDLSKVVYSFKNENNEYILYSISNIQ